MPEWCQLLSVYLDPEELSRRIWAALAEAPAPPPLGFGDAHAPATIERCTGPADMPLRLRETWEMQPTRDDEILVCRARVWDATLPDGSFVVERWSNSTRVTVRAEAAALARVQATIWEAVGQSPDEVAALQVLGRSVAFARDIFGSQHTRLGELRYTPMRLDWVRTSDDGPVLTTLDRLAADRPDVRAQAVLAAAVLEALGGRLDRALARVDAVPAPDVDLVMLRADLLSRLGRHDDALAALPDLAPSHPQAHGAGALRVALLRRAGRPGDAARAALALAGLPYRSAVWSVLPSHAAAVAVVLAEDAQDLALVTEARARLGADAALVAGLARRGTSSPAQWFLRANAPGDRLAAL